MNCIDPLDYAKEHMPYTFQHGPVTYEYDPNTRLTRVLDRKSLADNGKAWHKDPEGWVYR